MRTTVTLDPDVAEKLNRRMRQKKIGFKQAVNEVLRAGFRADPGTPEPARFVVEPHACGFKAGIDLDKLNQLADELESEELAHHVVR